ncbi:MAG: 30S ribosomal protein S16 [Deltaproteobacteria bacterium]|nr:30S ribosomal protein S16 [Deltaproteobacteria bacterium]
MLTLRFARAGTKKKPVFHMVATNSRNARDGRFIEKLGYYIPTKDTLVLNKERVDYWLSKGATTSETIRNLLRKQTRKAATTTVVTTAAVATATATAS